MSILLETTLGDVVIDLDIDGSPELCKNILKLVKARYYTSTLVYNVQPGRFCQLGDPRGDGTGGGCIYGVIEASSSSSSSTTGDKQHDLHQLLVNSRRRFLKSDMGRPLSKEECKEKGRVVATEMNGIKNTIGSQLLITTSSGADRALDGYQPFSVPARATDGGDHSEASIHQGTMYRSVGQVAEDPNGVLDQIDAAYCDVDGRPYADIRVIRAFAVFDPFDDPPGMDELMKKRGVVVETTNKEDEDGNNAKTDDDFDLYHVTASPDYERPQEEVVERRIQADQIDQDTEADAEKLRQREEEMLQREDKSRAVVLEILGDLPSADITAPENVLFVCKLNPVTEDEDLELIFSRFDEHVKAEIIRDHDTGASLQYAFVEFTNKDRAVEAYFKMNNALVDDRRIKVDFSQSVAKVWDKYRKKQRNMAMPRDPYATDRANNNSNSINIYNDRQRQQQQPSRGGNQYRSSKLRGNYQNSDDRYSRQRNDGPGRDNHQRSGHGVRGGDQHRPEGKRDASDEKRANASNDDKRRSGDEIEGKRSEDDYNDQRQHDSYRESHRDRDDKRNHRRKTSSSSSSNDDSDHDRKKRRRRSREDFSLSPDRDGERRRSKKHKKDKKKKKRHRHRQDKDNSGSDSDENSNSGSDERRRRHKHKRSKHRSNSDSNDHDGRDNDRRHASKDYHHQSGSSRHHR